MTLEQTLAGRARNFYTLALIGEQKNMATESVANYFKALFAVCDLAIYRRTGILPKDHSERFVLLREHDKRLYTLLDRLWSTYRETYIEILSSARAAHVRQKVEEALKYVGLEIPAASGG